MGESTTIIAFDQHAASVMAAVLLPGQQTAATQELRLGRRRDWSVCESCATARAGAMLLRSRSVWFRVAAVSAREGCAL